MVQLFLYIGSHALDKQTSGLTGAGTRQEQTVVTAAPICDFSLDSADEYLSLVVLAGLVVVVVVVEGLFVVVVVVVVEGFFVVVVVVVLPLRAAAAAVLVTWRFCFRTVQEGL